MFSNALKALSGGNIYKSYSVDSTPAFVSGPWKVYDATKRSNKQAVSVFVFEKKNLEAPLQKPSPLVQAKYAQIYEQLKREASSLSRLRHPSILEVAEPVEETAKTLIFATERVTASLATLTGKKDEDSFGRKGTRTSRPQETDVDELEIQKGLLQVAKGLSFLHEQAGILHSNLIPEAIYVNAKGDWKISGLGFSISFRDAKPQYDYPEYDPRLPKNVQRDIDFAAPEFVIEEQVDPLSDMFSLGCLIVAMHNRGASPVRADHNTHVYRKIVERLDRLDWGQVPSYITHVLPQLLTRRPVNRLSASAFQSSKFSDNILMNTIRFLEAFPEKSDHEKASFMRGLLRVLPQFPDRVLQRKVLPSLLEESKDHPLLHLTIPNIYLIITKTPQSDFSAKVLPKLKTIFLVKDQPQATVAMLEGLHVVKEKATAKEFKEDVMPLIYAALESGVHYVQDKALKVIGEIAADLDFTTIKSRLFPKVADVFTKTSMLSVQVTALETFLIIVKHVDKYLVTEKILPLLQTVKTKEPAVLIAALAVYEESGKMLDLEIIAAQVLPRLWELSLTPLLNLQQFKTFMKVIKDLSSRIEEEHGRKLADLGSVSEPINSNTAVKGPAGGAADEGPIDFETLVLGGNGVSQPNSSTNSVGNSSMGFGAPMEPVPSNPFPSRQSPAIRAAPPKSTSPAPTFSWSTQVSPQARPPPAPARQQPLTGLSSFPVMQSTSQASYQQPTTNYFQSQPVQPVQRPQPPQPSSTAGTGIDWSAAMRKPTQPIPPPPQNNTFGWSTQNNNATTNSSMSSFPSIMPPPNSGLKTPSIPPPPKPSNGMGSLDAYKPLL
ncbi:hypothetical protein YB2330_001178 [Saitoella coloradoensis]